MKDYEDRKPRVAPVVTAPMSFGWNTIKSWSRAISRFMRRGNQQNSKPDDGYTHVPQSQGGTWSWNANGGQGGYVKEQPPEKEL